MFSDASIPKAGVAVNGDAACLRKWGGLTSVEFQGLVQLEDIGLERQGGLKALAEELLFEDAAGLIPVHVEKDMTLTISDWEQYPLPQAQITYAAMGATKVTLYKHKNMEQVGRNYLLLPNSFSIELECAHVVGPQHFKLQYNTLYRD